MSDTQEPVLLLPELVLLSNLLEEKPHCFVQGSHDVQTAALDTTKFIFDLSLQSEFESAAHITKLITSLNPFEAPQTRSQTQKREHSLNIPPSPRIIFNATPLVSLFTENMDEDQIWSQLDLRANNICEILDLTLEGEPEEDVDENLHHALEALENGVDVDLKDLQDNMDVDVDGNPLDEDEDAFLDEIESEEDTDDEGSQPGDDDDLGEAVMSLHDSSGEIESDADADPSFRGMPEEKARSRRKNAHGKQLDDGFFNLASFNAETEQAEAKTSSKGHLAEDDDDLDDDDMSVDFFAPVDEVQNFGQEDMENDTGELHYRDFFEPPRLAAPKIKHKATTAPSLKAPARVRFHEEVRVKKIKAKGKNLPLYSMDDDEGEEEREEEEDNQEDPFSHNKSQSGFDFEAAESESDGSSNDEYTEGRDRETIERLKDDLFAEEEEVFQDLSAHEKRLAVLREQIHELESENVGQKDWVLMGEAGSRARPQNSLLEEDLEFERVMKAIPVVTEETVQILEDRIKARILEDRFDDVVRIRATDDKPFLPSRFFELKDTKSSQSLAQIYENEYIATQTDGSPGDDRDGKLQKEHNEIENIWESICGKLDALCNTHFTPKQPKTMISTILNVSTTSLESALPTTKSVSSMLAPEEVFAPSSRDLRARSELTPGDKRTLRNKERKAKKKSRDRLDMTVDKFAKKSGIGGVKRQKQAALESVVKNGKGVTVVGKKGKTLAKKDSKSRT